MQEMVNSSGRPMVCQKFVLSWALGLDVFRVKLLKTLQNKEISEIRPWTQA